jgi:hypothetical protein
MDSVMPLQFEPLCGHMDTVCDVPNYRESTDEVMALTWAVIDGVANDSDRRRLSDLLDSERRLREHYSQAVQLDCHLQDLMGSEPAQLGAA